MVAPGRRIGRSILPQKGKSLGRLFFKVFGISVIAFLGRPEYLDTYENSGRTPFSLF